MMTMMRARDRSVAAVSTFLTVAAALAMLTALAGPAAAAERFVGVEGRADGAGTKESPWDIASALGGRQKVEPGDAVLLLGGTYRRRPEALFDVRLIGEEDDPIHVRPAPGARAIIDGGLSVVSPSAHLWVHDLEILVSENSTLSREIDEPGSHPESYGRPWGGLNVMGGEQLKFIHLTIHDCAQGISCWSGAKDVEIYGCLAHDNGWKAPDRGHGHSIYTQNQEGTKTIRHSIFSALYPGSYTVHAYGSSRAYVDHYLIEENICHTLGPFLVGGGRPSRDIRVKGNVLHGVSMRIGYTAPYNEDCEVRGNLIVNAGLEITNYRKAVSEGNRIVRAADPRPDAVEVRWFPSRYDPHRAHLAVINWPRQATVKVDAGAFLKDGDRFRVQAPRDLHGKPLVEGLFRGGALEIPVEGEFAALVVFREPPR